MTESQIAAAYLHQTIADAIDPAVKVYRDLAPKEAEYPFVVFGLQASSDQPLFGDAERVSDLVFRVVVSDRSRTRDAIAAIADEIDLALEKAGTSGSGFTILSVIRESSVEMTEASSGATFVHHGGVYRVRVQET